jgi:hypothetical protein
MHPKQHSALAFVHLMKTGGQTMRTILRKNFGADHCDMLLFEQTTPRDWRWIGACYPRLRSIAGHGMVAGIPEFEELHPEARYFTILREPVERAVSHYQFLRNGGHKVPEFEAWLAENANYITRKLAGRPDAAAAIKALESKIGFVGFVETYDESLLLWRRWAGEPDLDLTYRAVNRARDSAFRARLVDGELSRETIAAYHQEDIKVWDHAYGTLRERQRLAYGPSLDADVEALRQACASARNENLRTLAGKWKRNLLYRPGVRKATDNPYK